MKKALFVVLLMTSTLGWTQKQKPAPADFTITVHVQSSQLVQRCTDVTSGSSICRWAQLLRATIDGGKIELSTSIKGRDLLRTGDYKARVANEETKRAYEYARTYELMFADGQTRQYFVVGESE